ncbi:protein unc-45 homolog B-like [Temnothorax americanus]|uniref:protein unc-45 homolog B-like n=1 Tax=Temnothorax americanus TaxID=1964332 RepID=UPI00406873ED
MEEKDEKEEKEQEEEESGNGVNDSELTIMMEYAVKSLSYLTSHVEVKEEWIKNQQAVKMIIRHAWAKTNDQSVIFDLIIILVNLCSAYVEQEHMPEIIELVIFAERYFEGYRNVVGRGLSVLVDAGVTSALVSFAKTDSQNCKELVVCVFHAICSQQNLRELVGGQHGGAETLLSLALSGTDKGKNMLHEPWSIWDSRPTIAFPGDLMMRVIQPITNLLTSECSHVRDAMF